MGRTRPLSHVSKSLQLDRIGRRVVKQRRQHLSAHRKDFAFQKLLHNSVGPKQSQEAGNCLEKRQMTSRSQAAGPFLKGERFVDFFFPFVDF